MFIEAENLEALKILQKAYAGSVKMIYIDPPYNTGSDSFIYPDKFSESREEYARRVGDTDDAGYLKRDGVFQGAWRKNGKDSGHYHSNWLSMMLPRLHLAKTLLREDGVIFISIDDNEQAQLKLLCDEVFGAENFVIQISWRRTDNQPNIGNAAKVKEYVLCYTKNISDLKLGKLALTEKALKEYRYSDDNGVFRRKVLLDKTRGRHFYEVKTKSGNILNGPWMIKKEEFDRLNLNQEIYWTTGGDEQPYGKLYLDKTKGQIPNDFWGIEFGTNQRGSLEVENLFKQRLFDFPKPTLLIKNLLNIGSSSDDLILDFFSGSGTTAHAVMQLNAEDGGSRRFICVQLPEETDEKSEARKAGFDTIAEIAKERIRRAGRQISDSLQDGSEIDTGFKVFKLAESGFKQWRQPGQADTEALQRELSLNIDSVLSETSSENLLYELMLRMGLKLTCKVSFSDDVYFVEDEDTGGLYAFLLERVDQGLIDAVLEKHPVKVAALDRLFEGNDALKSNTVLQMKDAGVMFDCV